MRDGDMPTKFYINEESISSGSFWKAITSPSDVDSRKELMKSSMSVLRSFSSNSDVIETLNSGWLVLPKSDMSHVILSMLPSLISWFAFCDEFWIMVSSISFCFAALSWFSTSLRILTSLLEWLHEKNWPMPTYSGSSEPYSSSLLLSKASSSRVLSRQSLRS